MTEEQRPLWLIGGGGHGKVILALLRQLGRPVAAVLDDDRALWGSFLLGVPVTGPVDRLAAMEAPPALIAIGSNERRKSLADRFPRARWLTAVHPHAFVDATARIGPGTVVFAGAVVQAEAKLGNHVIVNTGATVDHDCLIGDYAHLCPGVHLAGDVRVGEGSLLGTGTSVIPGRTIGPWATVGAGAAVITDLPGHSTAVGVPARTLLP